MPFLPLNQQYESTEGMVDWLCQWEMQISTPHRIDRLNQSPKICAGDYVGDLYPYTKFGGNFG